MNFLLKESVKYYKLKTVSYYVLLNIFTNGVSVICKNGFYMFNKRECLVHFTNSKNQNTSIVYMNYENIIKLLNKRRSVKNNLTQS